MKKIWKAAKSFCAVLGVIVIIVGIGAAVMAWLNRDKVYIPKNTAVMIDFSQNFSEIGEQSLFDELSGSSSIKFSRLLQAIEAAGYDNRVKALIARLDTTDLDLAQIEDVARAIRNFQSSGKKAYVFSQGFGPLGQGNREYYLATFFDKIYMQPHTTIGLTGVSIEIPFLRKLLDKLGVTPEFYTRYEYKTAMMSLTDTKISQEYKKEMQNLADGIMTVIKEDIKNNRNIADIDVVINQAPISAEQGLEMGLIDDIMYLPELENMLKDENIEHFTDMSDYVQCIKLNEGNLPTIAYLTLNGIIDKGQSSNDFDGEYVIGSQSVATDIAQIADLPNLKAVIVRINSPGGDYNASDEIYFALKQLKKEKNVPIIVSMGGYAASGGYFVALAGDKLIAEPLTVTGSIGVLGGKVKLSKMWQKLGVEWETVQTGKNADILSFNKPFTLQEKQIFNESLDEIYDDFTKKVLENRHLTLSIDKVARGRVWLGWQALRLGLVDDIGGYYDALNTAIEMAHINPKEEIAVVEYPKSKDLSEKISELLLGKGLLAADAFMHSSVDIRYLRLFKRLQYDTVTAPFSLKM